MSSRLFSTVLRSVSNGLRSASLAKPLNGSISNRFAPVLLSRAHYSSPAVQLSEVLKQELKISDSIPNELDPSFAEYVRTSGFSIIEKEGKSTVQLVKEAENEIVRVFFDIDEVTDIPASDPATEEVDMEDEIEALDSMLCNVKVLFEKPSTNSGLLMNLFLQGSESSFMVDFVNYQSNTNELLNEKILKNNEFIDKFNYQGPRFSDLDESVQTSFESFLESKGIDESLADFIISYSEYKEEKEYRKWLKDISNFLN